MVKISETQWNFIYLGAGALVFVIFCVFIWFDFEEIDNLSGQYEDLQKKIQEGVKKKNQIKILKHDLWFLKEKYEHFKQVLPKKENIENFFIKFYDTLERFRRERSMKPWERFQIKVAQSDSPQADTSNTQGKKVQEAPPPRAKKAEATGPFGQTEYVATLPLTFNQLGQLLNEIENHEPFYGITKIDVGGMTTKDFSTDPIGVTNLEMICFSYSGTDPEIDAINQALNKFEPDENKKKEYENEKAKWSEKNTFIWTNVTRDPFNQGQVLKPIATTQVASSEPGKTKMEDVLPPPAEDQLKEDLKSLQNTRDSLSALAITENWMMLERQIKDKKYEADIKRIKASITPQNDKDGTTKNNIDKISNELKEWQKLIDEAQKKIKARQLVDVAEAQITKMQELYEKGKASASQELLENVKKIHNDTMPELRNYASFEKEIKQLGVLRKKVEELYAKADTQIKIIQLASKIKVYGIIYIKKNPDLSVAFIDKKTIHKNDILNDVGFVVHEIQENQVILRYKDETVPIVLKKNVKTTAEKTSS